MSIMEEYFKLVRAGEYKAEEEKQNAINEAVEAGRQAFNDAAKARELPLKTMEYRLAVSKAVITEAVSRLYMKSLMIENAENYADALMPVARREIVTSMKDINTIEKLYEHFEHSSPYLKALMPIMESIADKKCEDTEAVEAFDRKVILDPEDMKTITTFEKDNSSDIYAEEIRDRIVDVYKEEEAASKEQKEKVQAVVDSLSEIEGETVAEAVSGGVNTFDNTPKSLFNAIFMNKSRAVMNEAGEGAALPDHSDDILTETICTYTLLECIHSLGVKTYSSEEKERLMYEFYVN